MAIPPAFFDELRTRLSLADVVGRKVTWDMRKSNQAKGDMWAPCPFHQEKTASFHVDDRKGFYYCFGCHAKGDAIKFVRETENVGFMDAVEILAREAGMVLPAPDPKARERADRQTALAEVTEAALNHFRLQLKTTAAAEARTYLAQRGLTPETLARFEIGFAPAVRQGAFQSLTAKGFEADRIVTAGIATKPDDGSAPYDAMRDRIVFPIRDPRGRCIGFGGRAMSPNARAKYLNTRETPLFDKGRALYNHGPAREAAGKGQPLIVAEGYMDVIALVQAGFEGAVAPLGTAITADQLALLWRMTDEPVIALDGDRAGLSAAMRLIDVALPLLQGGKSLRFALMPAGQDPDDLIRAKGPEAMQALVAGAQPLIALLWQRETEGQVFDSPERKAALESRLARATAQIPDLALRRYYDQALKDLRWALFRPPRPVRDPGRGAKADAAPRPDTRATPLASGKLSTDDLRIATILATLARYPALLPRFETDLTRLEPSQPQARALAQHLATTRAETAEALNAELVAANLHETLENLTALGHVRIQPWIRARDQSDKAELCLAEEFAKLAARRGVEHELSEALEDLGATEDNAHLSWRLNHAIEVRQRAERPGARESGGDELAELSRQFRNLIASRLENGDND